MALEAVLFNLVPAWTTLFLNQSKAQSQKVVGASLSLGDTAEGKLAKLIVKQSSQREHADPTTSPDFCWLSVKVQDRFTIAKFPTEETIATLPFPSIHGVVTRLHKHVLAASTLSHSEYVAFCFHFFRLDNPRVIGERALEEAKKQREFFLSLVGNIRKRLLDLSLNLHSIIGDLLRAGIQHLLAFLTDGFAEAPNKVESRQLSNSKVLSRIGRCAAFTTRERFLTFRLERYINATKLDLVHRLDLIENNLNRHFDTMAIGLRMASILGSGPAEQKVVAGRFVSGNQNCSTGRDRSGNHDDDDEDKENSSQDDDARARHRLWKQVLYPTPIDRDLQLDKLSEVDSKITPYMNTSKNLFNALLALMTLRSAFLDDDGSVHQKLWFVHRVDGQSGEGFENVIEQESEIKSRTWLHAFQKTHDDLAQMFASLSGRHVLSIMSLLMTQSNRQLRMVLQLWPALKVNKRNDHFTSHPNGVLNTSTGEFIALTHPQRHLPAGLVVSKYFRRQPFPSTTLNLILAANHVDHVDVPFRDRDDMMEMEIDMEPRRRGQTRVNLFRTPDLLPFKALRIVLETQGYTRNEIGNIMAMMGRTRHPLRECDQFDVMNIFLGAAGTGKSSGLEMLKKVFDKGDVGLMQNRLEREFGLESFYKKKLVLGPDLNHKCTIDQGMLHSMIVGEGITVCRKNQRSLSVLWPAHLFWSLNVVPENLQDNDFSLLRRLFTTLFNIVLTKKYPNLLLDFEKFEIPIFLYLIVWHYHELLLQKPGASIWDICEPKFLEIRKNLLSQLNALEGFLRSPRLIRSALVEVKLDLAGMKIEDEQAYKREHLTLLDAKYEISQANQLYVRFPDKSVLKTTGSEPMMSEDDFWKEFDEYNGANKIEAKQDVYRGVFGRYGILEARGLPGFHQGAFVGVRKAG
jgi:hypothetical protein